MALTSLQPALLWRHFQTIAAIPHPSGAELALRDHLRAWADARGLETALDRGGNLIIRKAASPGMADRVGVILQAHLDMVCQKNSGHPHDFFRDPLQLKIDRGWVCAEGTTLGADNGIGVAAALAALEDETLVHGPLEVLLTLDEEAGMTGARALEPGVLQGELLFNLDTEEWGELYVGCAGGVDLTVSKVEQDEAIQAGWLTLDLALTGLKGGHSGCDIHLGRANAARLLASFLQGQTLRLIRFEAGNVRNAIPREAFATVAMPAAAVSALEAAALEAQKRFAQIYAGVEQGIALTVRAAAPATRGLAADSGAAVLDLLLALPCGVERFSQAVPGVVETSNNLGVVRVENARFEAILLARSLIEAGMEDMAQRVEAVARLAGAQCTRANAYPGWQPDLSSRALQVVRSCVQDLFGIDPAIKVIHAGLECGLLGAPYPNLEMVSFGPTIRDPHSPAERVDIESVGHFWRLLTASLALVPPRR